MRHASEGDQAFVVALLVAVIDPGAWEETIAIVLIGTDGSHSRVRSAECLTTILRLSEINIGHVTLAGSVIACVIERKIDITGDWIQGDPVIEAIDFICELVGHGLLGRPCGTTVIRVGEKDVSGTGGGQIHPRTIETSTVRAAGAVGIAGRIDQSRTE